MIVSQNLLDSIKESAATNGSNISQAYLDLVAIFPLYQIFSEKDLIAAIAVEKKISSFIESDPNCNEGIKKYLNALSSIIGNYKKEKLSIEIENNEVVRTEQIRRLVSELSIAEERQRRSIASDLHDHVGQTLTIIKMRLQELQGNNVFGPLYESVGEIRTLIEQTIAYTRSLTIELSPPVLYELGFDASIEWLVGQMKKKHPKIKFILQNDKSLKPLSDDLKISLFRSVSEIIQNVIKHANATHLIIELKRLENNIIILVNDNGRGFTPSSITNATSKSFGLFSIKERLSYFGGSLKIESRPGNGTKAIITVSIL
jgi:signal transduction histidine kinase